MRILASLKLIGPSNDILHVQGVVIKASVAQMCSYLWVSFLG